MNFRPVWKNRHGLTALLWLIAGSPLFVQGAVDADLKSVVLNTKDLWRDDPAAVNVAWHCRETGNYYVYLESPEDYAVAKGSAPFTDDKPNVEWTVHSDSSRIDRKVAEKAVALHRRRWSLGYVPCTAGHQYQATFRSLSPTTAVRRQWRISIRLDGQSAVRQRMRGMMELCAGLLLYSIIGIWFLHSLLRRMTKPNGA